MNAMRKLVVVESKLLARDWSATVFGLAFPAALLVILTLVFPASPTRTPT